MVICRRTMADQTTEIEVGENPTVTESETDVTASLWTKNGRRLYLNGFGLGSENRYVDLDTAELHGGYVSSFDVTVADGTLTIEDSDEAVVVVDLDAEADEDDAEDTDATADTDDVRAVADGGHENNSASSYTIGHSDGNEPGTGAGFPTDGIIKPDYHAEPGTCRCLDCDETFGRDDLATHDDVIRTAAADHHAPCCDAVEK